MTLTQDIGDSRTHRIPLRWGKSAFVPGDAWNLIFTAKLDPNDTDDEAVIQKQSNGYGITTQGSNAYVALIPWDTAGGEEDLDANPPVSARAPLSPGTLYLDIQAQRISDGAVQTVATGTLILTRDITRGNTTSVPIYTSEAPLPVQIEGPQGADGSSIATSSVTPPENPEEGRLWLNENDGRLYAWFGAWIEQTGADGDKGEPGEPGVVDFNELVDGTPAPADSFVFFDASDSNAAKKTIFTELAELLAAYFDERYWRLPETATDTALFYDDDVLIYDDDTLIFD